ncbi:hypothetical protein BD560DRAFT_107675 [Blakeslea trispora]|nr:hypothetical protein BD560DRAFT_107675 [Blakeslea trispora]
MKMSFLKLAFQHLAHPANGFDWCLVFYFVKYYHYYYFEPDSCTITATLAMRIPKKKTSSQTKKEKKNRISISWSTLLQGLSLLGLSHYLVYFALSLTDSLYAPH